LPDPVGILPDRSTAGRPPMRFGRARSRAFIRTILTPLRLECARPFGSLTYAACASVRPEPADLRLRHDLFSVKAAHEIVFIPESQY